MSEADTDAAASPDREGADSESDGAATTEAGADSGDEREEHTSRPRREVAVRILAAEYDEATLSYAESDEERAPTYVVTPTGARANRVFVVGVLTDVERVSGDVIRARIADPTGTFVVYAGQYQPDARGTFEETDPPEFVALTGKARTFSPDDADQVYASIRPESVAVVDAETRDRWAIRTAERTIERIDTMADVLATVDDSGAPGDLPGLPSSLAAGIPRARDHYGTTPTYLRSLRTCAREVAELVAGDRDAVEPPGQEPNAGDGSFADLPDDHSLVDRSMDDRTAADASGDSDPTATTAGTVETSTAPASESTAETTTAAAATEPDDQAGDPADGSSSPEREAGSSAAADQVGDIDDGSTADSQRGAEDGASADSQREVDDGTAADSIGDTDEDSAADSTQPQEPEGDDTAAASAGEDTVEAEVASADESVEDPLDPGEREQVEAEFGAEFESGTEVDGPGEAGIETPEPDDAAATDDTPSATSGDAEEASPAGDDDDVEADADDAESDSDDTETDLADAVMETMRELDDGDGADRAAVIERTAETAGADESVIEDAVTAALMDGRCYEPDDTTLKPI